MRRLVVFAAVLGAFLGAPTNASAQIKPVGAFDLLSACSSSTKPGWLSFSLAVDWWSDQQFQQAATCSQQTGMKWVLGFYGQAPTVPVETYAPAVRNRLIATGLLPHVTSLMFGEEWYGRFKGGEFASLGLDHTTTAGLQAGITIIRDWVGRQQGQLKAIFGLPVVYLETFVFNELTYGVGYWHPVPPNTDVLAIDAYVPAGTTFTSAPPGWITPEMAFTAALQTSTLPIVIVPQWFTEPTGHWTQAPTQDTFNRYAGWLAHPRVIAMWGFTWESRPWNGLVGIKDMPQQLLWLKQSLGVP